MIIGRTIGWLLLVVAAVVVAADLLIVVFAGEAAAAALGQLGSTSTATASGYLKP